MDEALADADLAGLGVGVGFYPNFPENHLVLTAREASAEVAGEKLREARAMVEARLAKHIFAQGEETLAGNVARRMTEKRLTLAVAESCTGGLITDRLTDIPGSSAFLERGVVTYSNAAKTALLGVPEAVIRRTRCGERRDGASDGGGGPEVGGNRSGPRRDGDRGSLRRDGGEAGGDGLHRAGRRRDRPSAVLTPSAGIGGGTRSWPPRPPC